MKRLVDMIYIVSYLVIEECVFSFLQECFCKEVVGTYPVFCGYGFVFSPVGYS